VKLAHLADLHLGFRQYHRQTSSGLNQREADVAIAFRTAIGDVIAERPDAVLLAGDIFHSVRPSNLSIVLAYEQLSRLRDALPSAPIVLIAGNHDSPRSTETGSILKLFDALNIDVATDDVRRFVYPALDLAVLAVPHNALTSPDRALLRPDDSAAQQVLLLHGEVEGVFPADRSAAEHGGAIVAPAELAGAGWNYVALGHYHVQHEVAPRVWYSGSLEYVSPNPWAELAAEREEGHAGKGWLLVSLPDGTVERREVASARKLLDLTPINAAGLEPAAIDAAIAARLETIEGGIESRIVRLSVRNVERHIARELDHTAIRKWKAEALHFQLDIRRPERNQEEGSGAPGGRQTLPEIVEQFLRKRLLPGTIDRDEFVRRGVSLVQAVEQEALEA
jgi:DNA repair exonuclease SbcCD nuclease subunit